MKGLYVGTGLRPAQPSEARQASCRWLKFNLVGGIGLGVQATSLAAFRSVLKVDYLLATALAVEIAVLHNFLWHERFTWADRRTGRLTHSFARLARFNDSNGLVSIAGNLLLMRPLVGARSPVLRSESGRHCDVLAG
jgi:putative flippase GtrA